MLLPNKEWEELTCGGMTSTPSAQPPMPHHPAFQGWQGVAVLTARVLGAIMKTSPLGCSGRQAQDLPCHAAATCTGGAGSGTWGLGWRQPPLWHRPAIFPLHYKHI